MKHKTLIEAASFVPDVAEDLSAFFSADEAFASSWTEEDAAAIEAEVEAFGADVVALSAAYITYNGRCGFANSGSQAYVVNKLKNRSVKVTIRVYWTQGINSGQYQTVKTLSAGGRRYIGCTRGNGVGGGQFSYRVVGVEVL